MLDNEIKLLNMVKSFFNCGLIIHSKEETVNFIIVDKDSIQNIIISHFLNYSLIDTKYLNFLSFKKAENIINYKEHLLYKDIKKLVNISKSMNTLVF